jgi:hypothetical protein
VLLVFSLLTSVLASQHLLKQHIYSISTTIMEDMITCLNLSPGTKKFHASATCVNNFLFTLLLIMYMSCKRSGFILLIAFYGSLFQLEKFDLHSFKNLYKQELPKFLPHQEGSTFETLIVQAFCFHLFTLLRSNILSYYLLLISLSCYYRSFRCKSYMQLYEFNICLLRTMLKNHKPCRVVDSFTFQALELEGVINAFCM